MFVWYAVPALKYVLMVFMYCAIVQVVSGAEKRDAIVVVSNHRQAVWSQMLLRDLHVQENGLDTVCLLQGDLRQIDRSAFEQLCGEIFPAPRMTGYNVQWQKLRVFVENGFRDKYKRMVYVSNNAVIGNLTDFYATIQSFDETLGLNANVCGMSTQGRYREFRKKYWGVLLPKFEPNKDDANNVCYDNKFFVADVGKMQALGITRSSVNQLLLAYPQEMFTRQESGFIQLLFWENTTKVHVDINLKYVQGCVLDDNDQCSW